MLSFEAYEKAMNSGRYLLINGAIDAGKLEEVFTGIHQFEKSDLPVAVILNSQGGDFNAGMGIYDLLCASKCQIITVAVGECSSIAGMIFMAGKIRLSYPHCQFMFHQPAGKLEGNADEIAIEATEINKMKQTMISVMREKTGLTGEKIEEMIVYRCYLGSDEAKNEGLIHEIIEAF